MISQETSNLLRFTKDIFHAKHQLACSEIIYRLSGILYLEIFAKSRSVKTYKGNDLFIPGIIWFL